MLERIILYSLYANLFLTLLSAIKLLKEVVHKSRVIDFIGTLSQFVITYLLLFSAGILYELSVVLITVITLLFSVRAVNTFPLVVEARRLKLNDVANTFRSFLRLMILLFYVILMLSTHFDVERMMSVISLILFTIIIVVLIYTIRMLKILPKFYYEMFPKFQKVVGKRYANSLLIQSWAVLFLFIILMSLPEEMMVIVLGLITITSVVKKKKIFIETDDVVEIFVLKTRDITAEEQLSLILHLTNMMLLAMVIRLLSGLYGSEFASFVVEFLTRSIPILILAILYDILLVVTMLVAINNPRSPLNLITLVFGTILLVISPLYPIVHPYTAMTYLFMLPQYEEETSLLFIEYTPMVFFQAYIAVISTIGLAAYVFTLYHMSRYIKFLEQVESLEKDTKKIGKKMATLMGGYVLVTLMSFLLMRIVVGRNPTFLRVYMAFMMIFLPGIVIMIFALKTLYRVKE